MLGRRIVAALAAAVCLLAIATAAVGQDAAVYYCSPPVSGSPPALYRWYVCWPDSNTPVFFKQSRWPMLGISPQHTGQFMRVQAVDVLGRSGPLSVASVPWTSRFRTIVNDPTPAPVPRLLPGYPNPFNPTTTIAVSLPQQALVRLAIYDPAGRLVRSLASATLPSGVSRFVWDGRDGAGRAVASGAYLCRMETEAVTETRRLLLVR